MELNIGDLVVSKVQYNTKRYFFKFGIVSSKTPKKYKIQYINNTVVIAEPNRELVIPDLVGNYHEKTIFTVSDDGHYHEKGVDKDFYFKPYDISEEYWNRINF